MTRIRTIKPAFFRSRSISDLDLGTRLTFIGLWTYVDDKGRGIDDARLVKAEIWPLDDRYPAKKVEADLKALEKHDHICRYQAAGERYLHVVKLKTHQVINRPQESRLPPCPVHEGNGDDQGVPPPGAGDEHVTLPEDSLNGHGVLTPDAGLEVEVEVERDLSLGFTGTHDGYPQAGENRDLDLERPPAKPGVWVDPLIARIVAVCTGDHRDSVCREAEEVCVWARAHVDSKIIDEAVGFYEQADHKPPVLPRAVATLIRSKAADHGIAIPAFKPTVRAVSA